MELFAQEIKEGSVERVKEYLVNDRDQYINAVIEDELKRPIHVVCCNGNIDIARLLIEYHCDIECEDEYLRPIHIACINGNIEIVQLLIESQCDIECEDENNRRPIHHACLRGHIDIIRLLIKNHCDIECEDKHKRRPIHYGSLQRHEDIVELLIENRCNIICEDENKWQPIHHASATGHTETVRLLISNNCDVFFCDDFFRFSLLKCSSIRISGSSISSISSITKYTPLEVAKVFKQNSTVHFLEKFMKVNSGIETKIQQKKVNELISEIKSLNFWNAPNPKIRNNMELMALETSLHRNMEKIINLMMDRKMDDKELKLLTNILDITKDEKKRLFIEKHILHRCIRDSYVDGFQKFCSADVINKSVNNANNSSSFLETAANVGCSAFIERISKKTVYNKEIWRRARQLAQQNGHMKIAEAISERKVMMSSRSKRNFSLLHTAVCDNDPDMVKYLLKEKIVDANLNHEIFGTALALAHSLWHRRCISVLEEFNVDTNTQNKFGQTPLHEGIASGTCNQYLLENCDKIDREGFNNLTALHCAVMEGCVEMCDKLTDYEANCTVYANLSNQSTVTSGRIKKPFLPLTDQENALTLCLKFNQTIFPCFLSRLDQNTSNCRDGSNNSLLHLAVLCLKPEICRILLGNGAAIDATNHNGNNCISELISNRVDPIEISISNDFGINDYQLINDIDQIINVLNALIEFSIETPIDNHSEALSFQNAYQFNNEKLMMMLFYKSPDTIQITENDFKLALEKQWFDYLELLINLLPNDLIISIINKELVLSSLCTGRSSILKSLFEKASGNVQKSVAEDILLNAAMVDNEELFNYLLGFDKEICDQPKLFETGESLLTCLLKEKKTKYFWKLMKSNHIHQHVNLKNRDDRLPLQIAIGMEEMEIADHLLFYTHDIDNMDNNGETALMQMIKKISICENEPDERNCLQIIRNMITNGGDIYMKICGDKEIIDLCSKISVKNEIIKASNFNKPSAKTVKEKICRICYDQDIECVFQCGHTFCLTCSNRVEICPLCKTKILNRTRMFID